MSIHPGQRLIQLALNSFGYDPGKIDGWFGPRTAAAARAFEASFLGTGPARSSEWAIVTLRRGLIDLGWLVGPAEGPLDAAVLAALGAMLDADGLPKAAAAPVAEVLTPAKPVLRPVQHGNVLRQGSAGYVIDHFMQHTTATPGDWWMGQSNAQMLAAVRRMHTLPASRGGRGWSDVGYHFLICPDGEVLEGRALSRIGAGAIGFNRGVCHVAMVPIRTITATGLPETFYTARTLAAMRDLIERVADRTPIRRLSGHREVAAKLCPGFVVIDRDWTSRAVA